MGRHRWVRWGGLLATLGATVIWSGAAGASFDDVIRAVNTTRPDATTQVLSGQIYAATVTGTILDNDGNNENFADGDAMNVTLANDRGQSLTFNGTEAEFQQFVTDNADEIAAILFPSGIATSVSGHDDAQSLSLGLFNNLVAPAPSPGEHALATGEVEEVFPLRQVSALFQVEDFEVDGVDGIGLNLVPGYDLSIGRFQLGFSLPFKYSFLDDEINTDSYNLGLDLHGAYPVFAGRRVSVLLLGGGLVDALFFTSDAIDGGFLRYGGFGALSVRAVVKPVLLSGGVSYSLTKFDIVGVGGSEELDALVAALEDRPLDQQLNLGFNVGVPLGLRYLVNLRVSQSETVGSSAIEEGKQSYTVASLSFAAYFSAHSALDLGYQRLFGAEDLKSQSVFLLSRYNF